MMKRIVLIDAYSQIFRAFYAIRALTNSKGEPTNAVYLFTKILLTLEENYPADAGALLFDCGKVQSRLAVNPQYKANREAMPEDLRAQIPAIRTMAAAFGWALLQHEEFEADDLIAGFALRAAGEGNEVLIVTSDKDIMQLIGDRVSVIAPAKNGGFEERRRAECIAKFGVPPELLADYLALLGDSADNIAGVPGIGPKGAAELLNAFGASEKWLNDPSVLAGSKFEKKMAGNFDLFRRNRSIILLKSELPEKFRSGYASHLVKKSPDWRTIRCLCNELELKSLLKSLPDVPEEDDLFAPMPETEENASGTAGEMIQGELF